jgi:hypothetical protein
MVHDRRRVVRPDPAAGPLLFPGWHQPWLGQVFVRHLSQLRQVGPDVAAVRVETQLLPGRAEDAPGHRLRVSAHRCDPLPVAVVAGLVAIQEQPHEPGLAPPPVNAEILGQERAHHHTHPVVHPAFPQQLPHARVHQREPGSALGPGGERRVIGGPVQRAAVAGLELLPRVRRVMGQHVLVEVAPAQLAAQGRCALGCGPRPGQLVLHRPRGQATEPQIRRQPG